MSGSDRGLVDYLRDIQRASESASTFVQGLDFDAFASDMMRQYAVA